MDHPRSFHSRHALGPRLDSLPSPSSSPVFHHSAISLLPLPVTRLSAHLHPPAAARSAPKTLLLGSVLPLLLGSVLPLTP